MRRLSRWLLALVVISVAPAAKAEAAELRGSRASMKRQHTVAVESGYAFAKRPSDVRRLVEEGKLVELEGNEDYDVSLVRYPYALPEVRTLIERLSQQYRRATGEKLVVTSLVRPTTRQPSNAHPLSVHPAGMAVDLRVPRTAASRRWLESTLLSLEEKGLLDVTREYHPPHFHVAVFPRAYREYVERRLAAEAAARTEEPQATGTPPAPAAEHASAAAPASRDAPAWVASLVLLLPVATATGARALRARRRGGGSRRTRPPTPPPVAARPDAAEAPAAAPRASAPATSAHRGARPPPRSRDGPGPLRWRDSPVPGRLRAWWRTGRRRIEASLIASMRRLLRHARSFADSSSFSSGHAMMSMIVYTTLACLIISLDPRPACAASPSRRPSRSPRWSAPPASISAAPTRPTAAPATPWDSPGPRSAPPPSG